MPVFGAVTNNRYFEVYVEPIPYLMIVYTEADFWHLCAVIDRLE